MTLSPTSIIQKIRRKRERTRAVLQEFVYDQCNSPFTIPQMYEHLEKALGDAPSQEQLSAYMRELCEMSLSSFRQESGYYSLISPDEQAEFHRRVFGR